jgi:exonuclease SbcC
MTYPKIHSLSTIGIIHHHNCDYHFHPLRTDFTGESGCGKSMISDILQLILVGPGAYESSTIAYGDRKPQNMVQKKNGVGQGYIFINIAVDKQAFLLIGCFIEGGAGKVLNFIVQQGYDWNEGLTTFSLPISYTDFIDKNTILPFEKLQSHLKEKGYLIKRFPIKQYHEILFKNEILPVDLSQSERSLITYAQILRSFSRGKVFSKKSRDLKDFLFGDEKERELKKEFEQDVKNVKEDIENHKTLKEEIELVSKKQATLSDLKTLYDQYRQDESIYYKTRIVYWGGLKKQLEQQIITKQSEYDNIFVELYNLQSRNWNNQIAEIRRQQQRLAESKQSLLGLIGKKEELDLKKKKSQESFFKHRQTKEHIDHLDSLLLLLNTTIENVKTEISKDRRKKQNQTDLEKFETDLEEAGLTHRFKNSEWSTNFRRAKDVTKARIGELQSQIAELTSFSVFADIKNEESLAKWGLDYFNRPLSLKEESILLYFQRFPSKKPVANERYLWFRNELFENLDIKDQSESGFWLNLDGVFEFIPYTSNPLLDTNANQKKLKELQKLSGTLQEKIKSYLQEKKEIEDLMLFLDNISNVDVPLAHYNNRTEIRKYKPKLEEEITDTTVDLLINSYGQKETIQEQLSAAEKESSKTSADLLNYESNVSGLNTTIDEITQYFEKSGHNDPSLLIETVKVKLDNIKQEMKLFKSSRHMDDQLIAEIESQTATIIDLSDAITTKALAKNTLKDDLNRLKISETEAIAAYNNSVVAFTALFTEDLDSSFEGRTGIDDPEKTLFETYRKSKSAYDARYAIAVESMEDKFLKDSGHLGKLAHAMLPTIFKSSRVDETTMDLKISEKLNELNHRASNISERKIEILSKAFSKVHDTYSEYLGAITQIRNYFKGEDRRITGGNRVSLTYIKSKDFPEGWLAPFRKKLDSELTHTGLFASLAKEVDIYDMMQKAFQESGGSVKVTADELLNPKSYFELEFDLKLENDTSNDGSTGQTYAATALLGIARLSHVEKNTIGKKRKGVRFMPIDEAEGLGSNYNLLYQIAKEEDYQIISMSIEPVGDFRESEQYIYFLNENPIWNTEFNPPFAIFSGGIITEDIQEYWKKL